MKNFIPHRLRLGLVAAGTMALASACTRGPVTSTDDPNSPIDNPIRVAVVMPQTGSLGEDGQDWIEGVRLATQEINAAGGPLIGRPVQLIMLDSRTDSDVAVRQALRAVDEEGAIAIIGDAGSGGSLAIYDAVSSPRKIPQVSCCSTSPALTDRVAMDPEGERYFFRMSPSDASQGIVVARMARGEVRGATSIDCHRMAVLYMNDAYGEPFARTIKETFEGLGGTIVADIAYVDEQSSYTPEVNRLASANPECIAFVGYPETVGTIMRDWVRIAPGSDAVWIGTDGLRTDALVTNVGATILAQTTFYGTSPVTQSAGPAYDDFESAHLAVFGREPPHFVANNYDAAAMLYLAIARAGNTEPQAIMAAVRSLGDPTAREVRPGGLAEALQRIRAGERVNYRGASGPVDVDEFGDVVGDYEIWRVTSDGRELEQVGILQASELE